MPKILTKKDIKEVVVEVIEPFARSVQSEFIKVNQGLDGVGQRLTMVEQRLAIVEQEVREMRESASELFIKLDRFISLYEKQEQELLSLSAQLKRLEERVNKLELKRTR